MSAGNRGEWVSSMFFAADPSNGEFSEHDSLEKARKEAQDMLDAAGEDAFESGWSDDPPQICYGVIVGGCFEKNRGPMTGKDAERYGMSIVEPSAEMVDFELREYSASPAPPPSNGCDGVGLNAIVALDRVAREGSPEDCGYKAGAWHDDLATISRALAAAPQSSASSAQEAGSLLPCPFCGPGESTVGLWFDDVHERWRVGCGRCGASTGVHGRASGRQPAIGAWNRRGTPATPTPEAGKIDEAMVERVAKAIYEAKTTRLPGVFRTWPDLLQSARETYRQLARAALGAAGLAGEENGRLVVAGWQFREFRYADRDGWKNLPDKDAFERYKRNCSHFCEVREVYAIADSPAHPESAAQHEPKEVMRSEPEEDDARIGVVSANTGGAHLTNAQYAANCPRCCTLSNFYCTCPESAARQEAVAYRMNYPAEMSALAFVRAPAFVSSIAVAEDLAAQCSAKFGARATFDPLYTAPQPAPAAPEQSDETIAALRRRVETVETRSFGKFYDEVCQRAEANMLRTGKLEGMHWRAMQDVKAEWDATLRQVGTEGGWNGS
jgi:hypothetical protein